MEVNAGLIASTRFCESVITTPSIVDSNTVIACRKRCSFACCSVISWIEPTRPTNLPLSSTITSARPWITFTVPDSVTIRYIMSDGLCCCILSVKVCATRSLSSGCTYSKNRDKLTVVNVSSCSKITAAWGVITMTSFNTSSCQLPMLAKRSVCLNNCSLYSSWLIIVRRSWTKKQSWAKVANKACRRLLSGGCVCSKLINRKPTAPSWSLTGSKIALSESKRFSNSTSAGIAAARLRTFEPPIS